MKYLPVIFCALAAPAWAQCETSSREKGKILREQNTWMERHKEGCTLCAGGTLCHDGFDKKEAVREKTKAWTDGHLASGCDACAKARCEAADKNVEDWLKESQARHQEKCRQCREGKKCPEAHMMPAEIRRKFDAWKREHPALCEKCAPACDEWKKRLEEAKLAPEDAVKKHKEKCGNCKTEEWCERKGQLMEDVRRARAEAWKKHQAVCGCSEK